MTAAPRLIVALDYASATAALALAERLDPALCRLKIGKILFTVAGPDIIAALRKRGFDVFLDLKFHDIPNTVAGACQAAAAQGVWMLSVHAQGGERMLAAARQALAQTLSPRPLLIAVTVLTSLTRADLAVVGITATPEQQALRLARLAQTAGLDGVVCSAHEASILRAALGPDFCLVTPGIRPAGSAHDDQQRVLTPAAAIQAGADYLVVGRPVTQATDPLAALAALQADLSAACGES